MSYKLLLLMAFLGPGCKNPVAIKFSEYKKYSLKEEHTSVILLESFIIDKKCDSAKQIFYTNAFLCKTAVGNDTVMVFSICKPAYRFLKESFKDERDLIIDSSKTLKDFPDQVFVNVEDRVLKKGYKYVVADLIKLEY